MNEVGEFNDTDGYRKGTGIQKVNGRNAVDRQEALQLDPG
jgi:hypothetical protein